MSKRKTWSNRVVPLKKRGSLVVISAPSGAGKTTLVHELIRRRDDIKFSVSYTTRPARRSEAHGKDYFFVSDREFSLMLSKNCFLESARVFGHWYGTRKKDIEVLLKNGDTVLLEIDWQGARQVRSSAKDAIGIFILPPSLEELERRLRGRGTDSEEVIDRRLRDAISDMTHWDEFDYVLVGEEVENSVKQLEAILNGLGSNNVVSSPEIRSKVKKILKSRDTAS